MSTCPHGVTITAAEGFPCISCFLEGRLRKTDRDSHELPPQGGGASLDYLAFACDNLRAVAAKPIPPRPRFRGIGPGRWAVLAATFVLAGVLAFIEPVVAAGFAGTGALMCLFGALEERR